MGNKHPLLGLSARVGPRQKNEPADVAKIQNALLRHGYLHQGSFEEKVFDEVTAAALRRFQIDQTKYRDLRIDPGGPLEIALARETLPHWSPYLNLSAPVGKVSAQGGRSSRSWDTALVQERLLYHGYLSEEEFTLGILNNATIEAILHFQKDQSGGRDGVVTPGEATSKALKAHKLPEPRSRRAVLGLSGRVFYGHRKNDPEDVAKVRKALVRHGYLREGNSKGGEFDLVFARALRLFQSDQTEHRDQRVDVGGALDKALARDTLEHPVCYLNLSAAVGQIDPQSDEPPHAVDVALVQERLVHHRYLREGKFTPGKNDQATLKAIVHFQRDQTKSRDGVVTPGGATSKALKADKLESLRSKSSQLGLGGRVGCGQKNNPRDVDKVQRALLGHGYLCEGSYRSHEFDFITEGALERFLDDQVVQAWQKNSPSDVQELQSVLVQRGYLRQGNFRSGEFDAPTREALKQFLGEPSVHPGDALDLALAGQTLPNPVRYLNLSAAVGQVDLFGAKKPTSEDLRIVRERLAYHGYLHQEKLNPNAIDQATIEAISRFQREQLGFSDGIVSPGYKTSKALKADKLKRPRGSSPVSKPTASTGDPIAALSQTVPGFRAPKKTGFKRSLRRRPRRLFSQRNPAATPTVWRCPLGSKWSNSSRTPKTP